MSLLAADAGGRWSWLRLAGGPSAPLTAGWSADVIVPVHNGERTVRWAIESALRQATPGGRLRVLAVDDGSTDGSAGILAELSRQDPRLVVMRQPNQGPAAARSRGLREASAEMACFLSQDVALEPDWLATAAAALQVREGAAIVQGPILPAEPPRSAWVHTFRLHHPSWNFPSAAIAYRRRALEEAGPYLRPELSGAGDDTDLAWRVLKSGWDALWLDGLQARHAVLAESIRSSLRRARGARRFPLVVKLHPETRRFLPARFLWAGRAWHLNLLLLLLAPSVAPWSPWAAAGVLAGAYVYALRRTTAELGSRRTPLGARLAAPLRRLLLELVTFAGLAAGSARHRCLVL